jgi:hypothetical protein
VVRAWPRRPSGFVRLVVFVVPVVSVVSVLERLTRLEPARLLSEGPLRRRYGMRVIFNGAVVRLGFGKFRRVEIDRSP